MSKIVVCLKCREIWQTESDPMERARWMYVAGIGMQHYHPEIPGYVKAAEIEDERGLVNALARKLK